MTDQLNRARESSERDQGCCHMDSPSTSQSPRGGVSNRFAETLRSGRFVVTAEVAPPVAADAQLLLDKALPLRGLADAVNVTDGASARASMSALAAATILARHGIEPILQFTCRDRNRIA